MSEQPSLSASANPAEQLAVLRAQLDGLDDQIHDLLMQRAKVVERVGALGAKGRVPLRPGREADIIRRLLARHTGRLPRRTIVRIWRELVAGTTTMQGNYTIAVCQPDPASGYVATAREHFGALTPIRAHRTPAQAIGEVSAGQAVAAVVALIAGVLGFTTIAGTAIAVAKILFFVFLVLFLASLLFGVLRGV